ncbi:MAG: hypothetical protein ACFFD7_07615 [Candidatus Thorarchaeota archaeon]
MAILEFGINLGKKPLIEIKYYSSSDNILDPNIRAKFLTGIENFIEEAFGDDINVISLSDYKLICYFKRIQVPSKDAYKTKPLFSFAIIEQDTDPDFVKTHLKEIMHEFGDNYPLSEIVSKDSHHFQKFKDRVDEILGDLRLKIDDRLRTIFREKNHESTAENIESESEEEAED